ncbi:MAG: hypothetical protein ACJASB_002721 [Shewanella psychromarinicola]|jgi:hypothetical protein
MVLSGNLGLFLPYCFMACGHQRRGASPTTDQEEINGYSLFTLY